MKVRPLIKDNSNRKVIIPKRPSGGCGCGKKRIIKPK